MAYSGNKGRAEALRVISLALERLTDQGAASAQLSDLADAVDALRDGSYNVAVELGLASMRRKSPPGSTRPPRLARSLDDLKAEVARLATRMSA